MTKSKNRDHQFGLKITLFIALLKSVPQVKQVLHEPVHIQVHKQSCMNPLKKYSRTFLQGEEKQDESLLFNTLQFKEKS